MVDDFHLLSPHSSPRHTKIFTMVSGLKSAMKGVVAFLKGSNGYHKILANLKTASLGSRAWPVDHKQDRKIGVRMDWGDTFERDGKKWRNIVIQANKEAENATLKKIAAANSHKVLAIVAVPVDNPPSEEEFFETVRNKFE